ncbi:MAG: hypothetical protein F6K58_11510 [Symploca sp. SIO2E9]|nr:hypothetical protein [Symploca sp. SIO2E9]
MSEKRGGEIIKQTLQMRRRSRRGELKSHAKFRSPLSPNPSPAGRGEF